MFNLAKKFLCQSIRVSQLILTCSTFANYQRGSLALTGLGTKVKGLVNPKPKVVPLVFEFLLQERCRVVDICEAETSNM